ncbi:MAG: hypothetical protein Fur003_2780 [Candidatus Dojkabacteria bacterium]
MKYKKFEGLGNTGKTAITIAAGYVVVNDKKEFLLTKDKKEEMWKFPGGTVEDNEDFRKTAERELFEEVGLTSEEDREPIVYTFHKFNEEDQTTYYYVLVHYYTQKVTGEITINDAEIEQYKYFSKDELPANCAPNIKAVIEEINKKQ